MKILAVEDHPSLTRSLQRRGVTVVTTIAEAKEALAADPPDVVLLDHNLPDGLGSGLLPSIPEGVKVYLTGAVFPFDGAYPPGLRYLGKEGYQSASIRSLLAGEEPL